MGHVPSGFVSDLKLPLKLFRGDALLCGTDHVDSEKPLDQRKVRIVEDGPDSHAKLVLAVPAIVEVPEFLGLTFGLEAENVLPFALGADRAIGPAKVFKVGDALFLGVEPLENFDDGGLRLCHG